MGIKSLMYPGEVKALNGHKFLNYVPFSECINIMFDIETLGNDILNGAPVTQIGVAYFDASGYIQTMCVNVDSEECITHGLNPTDSTLEWISKQSNEVIESWFTDPQPISIALEQVNEFCIQAMLEAKKFGLGVAHWGHSPRFDMNMLERLYLIADLPVPWIYSSERCWRTIQSEYTDLLKSSKDEIEEATKDIYDSLGVGGGYHNAGYDAVFQSISLQVVINHINNIKYEYGE